MTSKAYIFIDGLEQTPMICAVTEIDERSGIGRFRYGKSYLAKFNRPDDIVNMVKVEHATMRMLNELLCCVAPTKTVHTASGDVLLVERFDTLNNMPHSHFLSAHSVFSASKVCYRDGRHGEIGYGREHAESQ